MTLEIYKYDSDIPIKIEVKAFEFRTNKLSNWLKVTYDDGSTALIGNVCTIKAKEQTNER